MIAANRVRNVALIAPTPAAADRLVAGLAAGSDSAMSVRCGDVEFTVLESAVGRIDLVVDARPAPHATRIAAGDDAVLRGVDAALFLVSGANGLDAWSAARWQVCAERGMPRAVVVLLDDEVGDEVRVESMIEAIAETIRDDGGAGTHGEGIVATVAPLLDDDDRVAGLLDLLTGAIEDHSGETPISRTADPEHLDLTDEARQSLLRAVVAESLDDALVERLLDGDDVPADTLVAELQQATTRGAVQPLLIVAMDRGGLGIPGVQRMIDRSFPAPGATALPGVAAPDGEPRPPLTGDPAGPLCALVLAPGLVRVLSGTLRPGSTLLAVPGGTVVLGDVSGTAGEIIVIPGLGASAGATLSAPDDPLVVQPSVTDI